MRKYLMLLLLVFIMPVQAAEPVPTLVPPTPIPHPETGFEEILPSESTVNRIQANGRARVGILFNAPPFGELNIRGELIGFDADVARSIAELWDVELELIQVTRNPEVSAQLLRTGEVDMLIAAQVHRRDLDRMMEFSQTYYTGRQALMVRADDPANNLVDMAERKIGVVIATPAETAINDWSRRTGISISIQTYLTLDQAYVALASGEVDGVVASAYRLTQVSVQQPELIRILNESIEIEPYAIAILRQDEQMRALVNHTLQHLTISGRLDEIHQAHFPGAAYTPIPVWDNIGEEAPTLAQYAAPLTFPTQYIVPRLQANRTIRVAGLYGVTADSDAPESEKRLDTFHRALLNEMAARWGATVEYIPADPTTAIDLVASEQADIAIGIEPNWNWIEQVDFIQPYMLRGDRMMVRTDDDINSFLDLPINAVIITAANDTQAAARAIAIAELPEVNKPIEIVQVLENDLSFALLSDEELEADAAFGDSLSLIPHIQANPALQLTKREDGSPRWYSPSNLPDESFAAQAIAMAVPRNDIDFRLLVEYTLQELERDGTLNTLRQTVMLPDEMPLIEIWPGSTNYLNFSLAGS